MLNIDIEYKRGILFIRLKGILNKSTSLKLDAILDSAIVGAGIKYLMINCEKLNSIDNEGLKVINKRCLELLGNEGKLLVCGFNEYVRLKIESSSLDKLIYKTNNEIGAFNIISI